MEQDSTEEEEDSNAWLIAEARTSLPMLATTLLAVIEKLEPHLAESSLAAEIMDIITSIDK